MKLNKIHIVNYRSIEDLVITTDTSCQAFIGINESGKSNILKAISHLSPTVEINKRDVRIVGADEKKDQEAYIEYHFEMAKEDMDTIYGEMRNLFYTKKEDPTIDINDQTLSIEEYYAHRNKAIYKCDIREATSSIINGSSESDNLISLNGFMKRKENDMTDSALDIDGNSIHLNDYEIFSMSLIDDSNFSHFAKATVEDLNRLFAKAVMDYVEYNLPNVIFWEFSSENILPPTINIQEFMNNPESCIPLKEMFVLAGYLNIKESISEALLDDTHVFFKNLLNNISVKSTEYLNEVWKDYQNVSFYLWKDGEQIVINIRDTNNYYSCDLRSDGFKRFITFLLMLSARVHNGEIESGIIIIDEPDIGLHIEGQKNLLEELLKISKNNLVFYSTHSIFMIDTKNIGRHFIVTKPSEITNIQSASTSDFTDDEVLYNALGYSVFHTLNEINIIFEGWSDKYVYVTALNSYNQVPAILKDYGTVHSIGVKNIMPIAKCLELAHRTTYIISDSDKTAKEIKNRYEKDPKPPGKWYTYEDILPESKVNTLEDFIKHEAYHNPIEALRNKYSIVESFDYAKFAKEKTNRGKFIHDWLSQCKPPQDKKLEIKDLIKELKNMLYNNLHIDDIEELYYEFLRELSKKIGNH